MNDCELIDLLKTIPGTVLEQYEVFMRVTVPLKDGSHMVFDIPDSPVAEKLGLWVAYNRAPGLTPPAL